jgi:hypothetical protein
MRSFINRICSVVFGCDHHVETIVVRTLRLRVQFLLSSRFWGMWRLGKQSGPDGKRPQDGPSERLQLSAAMRAAGLPVSTCTYRSFRPKPLARVCALTS